MPRRIPQAAGYRDSPSAGQGTAATPISEYEQRLEREIDIIKQMKFSGYFLIVWDFIRYAREQRYSGGAGAWIGGGFAVPPIAWRSRISIRCRMRCSLSGF